MDLYGDLPPAQGEVPTCRRDEAECPQQRSSVVIDLEPSGNAVTDNKTRKVSVGGVAGQSLPAFKPRQTKKSIASQRNVGGTDGAPLVDIPCMTPTQTFSKFDWNTRGGGTMPPRTAAATQLDPVNVSTPLSTGITSYETDGIPYEPHRPNDYLEWCAERLEIKRARRLEEENRIVLEAMEDSRKKLEDERSLAMKSGDIKRLEASAAVSAGRGRGVMNLPAWMTDKLNSGPVDEQQQQDQLHNSTAAKKRSLFTHPSTILLLCNIDKKIDADIEKDMEQECQKYGSVRLCLVREVSKQAGHPLEYTGEVCVYICFEKQESAVRAFRELNGRYFDGRKIVASFYDEETFRNTILSGCERDRLSD